MAELQNLVVTGDAVIVGKLRVSGDADIVAPEAEKAQVAEVAQVANRLASPIVIDGLVVDGSEDAVVAYTECTTAGNVAAKTAELEGFSLVYGAETTVKFINANTAANPTLNINGTGAIPIYYRGAAIPANYIVSNSTLVFRYNGAQFEVVGEIVTSRVDALESEMESHTHNYAGSATPGGAADSANKLNTDAGDEGTPVYFKNGVPVKVTSITVNTSGNAATAGKADEATTLTGMNTSVAELNYVKGVTSPIQDQLDDKAPADHTHNAAGTDLGFVKSGGDVTITNGVITVNDDSHAHTIANVDGLQDALDAANAAASKALTDAQKYTDDEIAELIGTASETRNTLGELSDAIKDNADVIAVLEETAAGKAPLEHTHNYAGSTTPGGAADSANKLNTDAGDVSTPVYFKNGVPVPVTSIKVNVSGNATSADKANEATTLTGLTATVTELNYTDGVTAPIQTQLDNKSDSDHEHSYNDLNDLPTIPNKTSQLTNDSGYVVNTTAAGTELGLVKSGGDVTITNGVITVNDDSHAHTIANVDGLQDALDSKSGTDHTHSYAGSSTVGGAADSANKLNTDAGDESTPVYFKNGVPVAVTGLDLDTTGNAATATNATNAATATTLTGLTATVTELNYVDGVTGSIQTQLDNKSDSDHGHSYNDLEDLPTIPTKISQLTNDAGYVTTDTTYTEATTSESGLMSPTDKSKLDGISIATDDQIRALFV